MAKKIIKIIQTRPQMGAANSTILIDADNALFDGNGESNLECLKRRLHKIQSSSSQVYLFANAATRSLIEDQDLIEKSHLNSGIVRLVAPHDNKDNGKDLADHLLVHVARELLERRVKITVVTSDKILARLITYWTPLEVRKNLSFALFSRKSLPGPKSSQKSKSLTKSRSKAKSLVKKDPCFLDSYIVYSHTRFPLFFNDAKDLQEFLKSLSLYEKRAAAGSLDRIIGSSLKSR
jgi:hypothetical protein